MAPHKTVPKAMTFIRGINMAGTFYPKIGDGTPVNATANDATLKAHGA